MNAGRPVLRVTHLLNFFVIGSLGCDTHEKPPTFMDRCEVDAGACEAPFECVPVKRQEDDPDPKTICTKACESTRECPSWRNESGHCKGDFQSLCQFGYCQGRCS